MLVSGQAEARRKRDELLAAHAAGHIKLTDSAAAASSSSTPAADPMGSESGGISGATPVVQKSPVVFLFPGQGSQAVGMLKEAIKVPAVAEMLATAKRVLGYDLLDICVNGNACHLSCISITSITHQIYHSSR